MAGTGAAFNARAAMAPSSAPEATTHLTHHSSLFQGCTHLLPGPGTVGLARRLHGRLEEVQPHQGAGQAAIVGDVGKDDPGCLVQRLIKEAVAHRLQAERGPVCGWGSVRPGLSSVMCSTMLKEVGKGIMSG